MWIYWDGIADSILKLPLEGWHMFYPEYKLHCWLFRLQKPGALMENKRSLLTKFFYKLRENEGECSDHCSPLEI